MGLLWVTQWNGISLGYLPEDRPDVDEHVGRVRRPPRMPNAWEAHYDPKGLLRHVGTAGFGLEVDDSRWRLPGLWSAAHQAKEAVDRRHDELTSALEDW